MLLRDYITILVARIVVTIAKLIPHKPTLICEMDDMTVEQHEALDLDTDAVDHGPWRVG